MRFAKHLTRSRTVPRYVAKSVASLVVNRFTTLYGSPTTHDEGGFVHEYHKALNGTDPDLLREAIDEVVKRQTVPAWPPVGACTEAVHQVAERRASERRLQEPKQDDYRRPTPEERARIAELFAGFKAKLAANRDEPVTAPRPEDWSRASRPAWEERMATSEIARQLSLPRNLRKI